VGTGGGQGDTEDISRLHADLQMKDQELHEKNQLINQLVMVILTTCKNGDGHHS